MKTAVAVILLALLLTPLAPAAPSRVKDLASLEGVRDNQLIGYGIVVGLNGTGDKRQTFFSAQTLANMLERMGVQVSPTAMLVRNMAAVIVTANLPPFGQPGTKIDVQVAAIGDASNLQGGLLLMTPLKGANGIVYAVGQGSVVTGGFVAGRGGNNTTVNHPTAGRIPAGAIIERPAPSVLPKERLRLQLHQADFATASRLADVINRSIPTAEAECESSGVVVVKVPVGWQSKVVQLIARVEELPLEPDQAKRIIINERTGTVVLGQDVVIRPVSILHGDLTVHIETEYEASQPAPFSQGKTVVIPKTTVNAKQDAAKNMTLKPGTTVDGLCKQLLSTGSTPRDIIAILQAMRAAGALEAEIEVI